MSLCVWFSHEACWNHTGELYLQLCVLPQPSSPSPGTLSHHLTFWDVCLSFYIPGGRLGNWGESVRKAQVYLKRCCTGDSNTQLPQKASETLYAVSAYLVLNSNIVPQDRYLVLCVTSKIIYIHKDKFKPGKFTWQLTM